MEKVGQAGMAGRAKYKRPARSASYNGDGGEAVAVWTRRRWTYDGGHVLPGKASCCSTFNGGVVIINALLCGVRHSVEGAGTSLPSLSRMSITLYGQHFCPSAGAVLHYDRC